MFSQCYFHRVTRTGKHNNHKNWGKRKHFCEQLRDLNLDLPVCSYLPPSNYIPTQNPISIGSTMGGGKVL